ncbi:7771_t:CDS:2 [Funneliformis caledonium]|uniref:7771_t:CDS:1 n=1 Tax=Funneliformis caledonium TaxID=1117310 RepID=A0A9N9BGA1_9GLOM|nr:7771_t:CDS:2 [Funneliformis caledonium]
MGRRSRQKNHLVLLSLKDKPIITEDSPFEGDSEVSSDDEVMWADSELDNKPGNTLRKLLPESYNNIDIISLSSTESEIESDFDDENELKKLIPFIEKKLQDKILLPEQK